MQNKKTYQYLEFVEMCSFKKDMNKSIELLGLNEVNTLDLVHENYLVQKNNESRLFGCTLGHKPVRYVFKCDFYGKGLEQFVLLISSVGPTSGVIYVYDHYLNLVKTEYVGHIDEVEIVKSKNKKFLNLLHHSSSGTNSDEENSIRFSF